MKIKLNTDVPVEERHGLKTGEIFTVKEKFQDGVIVRGRANEDVKVFFFEYDAIKEGEKYEHKKLVRG